MKLIQLLLPLYDNDKKRFPPELYSELRNELAELFGGITSYSRAPAVGIWKENESSTVHDDIIIYEVMVDRPDPAWWKRYRESLERKFMQEEIIIRSTEIQLF